MFYGKNKLVDRYADWLEMRGLKAATISRYQTSVSAFLVGNASGDVCTKTVQPYFHALMVRGLCAGSINNEIKALRSFCRFMYQIGAHDSNFSRFLPKYRKGASTVHAPLSGDVLGLVLAAPDLTTRLGWRDHVMLRLMVEWGLTSRDVVAIGVGDVDEATGWLTLPKHQVPLCDDLLAAVLAWRSMRKQMAAKHGTLFVSNHGKALQARSVQNMVQRYRNQVSGSAMESQQGVGLGALARGVTERSIRATFTSALLSRGVDLVTVGHLLGHKSLATTVRYLPLDMRTLHEAIKHHPRSQKAADGLAVESQARPAACSGHPQTACNPTG